jgi:hypothetical protein
MNKLKTQNYKHQEGLTVGLDTEKKLIEKEKEDISIEFADELMNIPEEKMKMDMVSSDLKDSQFSPPSPS